MTSGAVPRYPATGLLALVPEDWLTWWQRRHHVLSRLTRYFHVAWVTPPRHWRGPPAASMAMPGTAPPGPAPHVVCDSSRGLPTVRRPAWLARRHATRRIAASRAALAGRGCTAVILQIWRPEFAGAVDLASFDLSCYVIDDEYRWTADAPLDAAEVQLMRSVDHVFIHSPGLMERKGGVNPSTTLSPNGVDFAAHAEPAPEPPTLREIPRPRIGYVGVLKPTLDWPLLAELADAHGDWSFVLVGPRRHPAQVADPIRALASRPNVYLIPPQSPAEAARHVQHLDVCIMPYGRGTHMDQYGSPLKLHEYLAAGRPTVGAPLAALDPFRDVVSVASSPAEWSAAIAASLRDDATSPVRVERRRAVARRYDWDVVVDEMAEVLLRRLPG